MRKPRYLLLVVLSLFLTGGLVHSASVTSGIPLGDEPQALAISPPDDIAVVSTEEALSIVDLNAQSVIAEIPLEDESEGLAIDSGLNIALVANEDEGMLTVVDLTSFESLGEIQIGGEPEAIAVNPLTHIALVADSEDELLVAVDLQTYGVLGYVPLGHEAEDIAIDPELNLALALDENHRSVTVIDLNTWEVTGAVPVGKKPKAIDINPETHLAAVANEKDNSLSVIDLLTWETTTIPVGKHPIDVAINSLDNRALVICDGNEAELKDDDKHNDKHGNKHGDKHDDEDDDKHKGKHKDKHGDKHGYKDRSLLIVDLNSGVIVADYAINKHPEGVAVNPYTNIAGVIDEKTDSLTLIQLPNPVPHVDSVTPVTLMRGSIDAKIIISGSKFIKTSTVSIKSDTASYSPIPTFIDNHTLEVAMPGEMLQSTGTYQLTVTNPAPEGGMSNALELQVENPVPQISVLDPIEVEAGTSSLTLNVFGDSFFEDTTFYIDGIERAVNFIKRSKVEMELMATDLEVGGELAITAYNPPPGGGTADAAIFTVLNPLPVISSITPTEVDVDTPVTLTLNGEGFVNTSSVEFNGQPVAATYVDWNTLEAEIPAVSEAGDYGVKVINPAPGGGESSPAVLTVLDPLPALTSISPDRVESVYDYNVELVLSGSNFKGNAMVKFDGKTLYSYGPYAQGQIFYAYLYGVTYMTPGSYPVWVENPGGKKSNILYFTIPEFKPEVISVDADYGYYGWYITAYGNNFNYTTELHINGQPKYTWNVYPDGVKAYAYGAGAGTYEVVAVNGSGSKSEPFLITIVNPVPTIEQLWPSTITAGTSPANITIYGNNVMATSSVSADGQSLTPYDSWYSGLRVTIPPSIAEIAGTYQVAVTNPPPDGGTSNALTLTVKNPYPWISGISPSTIFLGGPPEGHVLTVTGTNLVKTSLVSINGQQLPVNYISGTQAEVTIPPGLINAPGQYPVKIYNPPPGGGETWNAATLTVLSPVEITSPLDGETISGSKVLVKGILNTTAEVGVVVNGVIADIYGDEWVANGVPLALGANTIEAVATEADGTTYKHPITVNVADASQPVELSSNVTSGLAPLTAHFSVSTETPNPVTNYQMDFEGDGVLDLTGAIFNAVSFTYNTEGIYYPTVTVTDSRGYTYSDTIAITVLSRAEMDALLKGKWEGMKNEILAGNIEGALDYFVPESRDVYRKAFIGLDNKLNSIFGSVTDIKLYHLHGGYTECGAIRQESGGAYSYPVSFVRDENGIWRMMGL